MSLPPDRPENTHDRLNREISRMRSRSIGFWGGWTLLIGIVGIYAALSLAPKRIDYLWAEVTGVTQLSSETGPDHVIGVLVDGAPQTARSPARLIHPLPGDTICLTRTSAAVRWAV